MSDEKLKDQEAQTRLNNKQRVTDALIQRCNQAGLVRRRGMTIADHAAFVARLLDGLNYMDTSNLTTLAELVIEAVQGAQRREWPAEATVLSMARGLQTKPIEQHRIVTSWLASREGPAAVAAGFEVELYWHLDKFRRPPSAYALSEIRADAEGNQRKVLLIQDRIARDVASADDRSWLEYYLRVRDKVRRIIADGQHRREVAA